MMAQALALLPPMWKMQMNFLFSDCDLFSVWLLVGIWEVN